MHTPRHSTLRQFLFLLCILAPFPNIALAHSGHASTLLSSASTPIQQVLTGFLHPLGGFDHLLAMLIIGLWAAQSAQKTHVSLRWAIPLCFTGALTLAAIASAIGIWQPTYYENGIALSLILLGLLVANAWRIPKIISALCATMFAINHGAAHGVEIMTGSSPALFILGMASASLVLHLFGIFLGQEFARHTKLIRMSGLATTLVGVGLVL